MKQSIGAYLRIVTPVGWVLIGAGAVSLVLGIVFDWAEFQVAAVAAGILILLAVATLLGSPALQAQIVLPRTRVHVGECVEGAVVLRGKSTSTMRVGGATIELPVGNQLARFRVKAMTASTGYQAGHEEGYQAGHEEAFAIPTNHRGVITLGPVRSIQGDPLGAMTRVKELTDVSEVFVHPSITLLGTDSIGFIKDVEGVSTPKLSSSDVSFHALREYRSGDDRRSIHWRTTARTGTLMVRQFEETMRAHILIALSTLVSDYRDPEDFELAVSAAASLGVSAFGQERTVNIYTSQGRLAFVSAMTMLDALSRIKLADTGDSLAQIVATASSQESEISVAALISGKTDGRDMRAASLGLPINVHAFGIRANMATPTVRSVVGDLAMVDLAQLEHMPMAMRSIS